MPQTTLQVCNSALLKLGGRTIAAFGSSTIKEEQLTTEQFPKCLGFLVRSHVWHFLKTIDQLTGGTATTQDQWSFIHTLPTDCVRILRVSVNDIDIDYEQVGNTIYAQYDDVDLRYVAMPNYSDVATKYPDDFAEALAYLLASDLVVSLTQNPDMIRTLREGYLESLRTARFNGAVEMSLQGVTADSWVNAHGASSFSPYPNTVA